MSVLDKLLMICRTCWHKWLDKRGERGTQFKSGCPKCGAIYWDTVEIEEIDNDDQKDDRRQ